MITSYEKVKKQDTSLHNFLEDIFLIEKETKKQGTLLQNLFKDLFLIKNHWKTVLYIDSPFCRQRCKFCWYFRCIPKNHDEITNFYNKILMEQIQQNQEVLEKTKFDQFAFGGGTPTIADAKTLKKVFKKIPHFREIPVKIIEVSPDTLTDHHIDLFREYNFTTVSIGAQTFSSGLLKKQGRPLIDKKKLKHLCKKIEQYGMISNIDLMLFLDEKDNNGLFQEKKDLNYALSELRPIEIALHTNYFSKRTKTERNAVLKLIKEMLSKHSEYMCVNSLLQKNEAVSQVYRLMRKYFNYTFYLQSVTPTPGNYGYNVFCLGYYKNSELWNSFYNLHFNVSITPNFQLLLENVTPLKYKFYKNFVNTRKKLGLYYNEFDENKFFIKKIDQKKFQKILKQIIKINKILYELSLRDKTLRRKIKKITQLKSKLKKNKRRCIKKKIKLKK